MSEVFRWIKAPTPLTVDEARAMLGRGGLKLYIAANQVETWANVSATIRFLLDVRAEPAIITCTSTAQDVRIAFDVPDARPRLAAGLLFLTGIDVTASIPSTPTPEAPPR